MGQSRLGQDAGSSLNTLNTFGIGHLTPSHPCRRNNYAARVGQGWGIQTLFYGTPGNGLTLCVKTQHIQTAFDGGILRAVGNCQRNQIQLFGGIMRNRMLYQFALCLCVFFLCGGSAELAQCNDLQMRLSPSTISAAGGSGTATITYINLDGLPGDGCGGLTPLTSSQSWVTFNPLELDCTPVVWGGGAGLLWTCTEPFSVAADTGAARSALISGTLHDYETLVTLTQILSQN